MKLLRGNWAEMLSVSLGPTPEKGPAGIQETKGGQCCGAGLATLTQPGGSGVGGRGAYDVSGCHLELTWILLPPPLFYHQVQAAPRGSGWRWPPATGQTLKTSGAGAGPGH